jgi:uncharacterized membrane protein (DUF485 family)
MLHEPAPQSKHDERGMAPKARLGIKLFWAYCIIYAGFTVITTISPKLMERRIFLGLNLAVVYGFGLIILAIVLGLIYNRMCTGMEDRDTGDAGKED